MHTMTKMCCENMEWCSMTGKELLDRVKKKLKHDILGVAEVHGRWFLELGNRKTGEPLLMAGGFSVDLKTK